MLFPRKAKILSVVTAVNTNFVRFWKDCIAEKYKQLKGKKILLYSNNFAESMKFGLCSLMASATFTKAEN